MNKSEYQKNCFSPNWVEIDLDEAARRTAKEVNSENYDLKACPHDEKEERLESKRRKDLNTLLKELDEIKQSIERAAEKQHRLANLMSFYTGEFAK